jgi:hypothetical protein
MITLLNLVSNFVVNTLDLVLHQLKSTHRSLISKSRRLEKPTRWFKVTEFRKFITLVAWATWTVQLRSHYALFAERITKLVKACGSTWTFSYLKESLRLTTRALAGCPEHVSDNPIRVKRDKYGLPTIIPDPLRHFLRMYIDEGFTSQTARRSVIAILTILSIFRSFETKVSPKLDTIIDPFTGQSKTLPQEEVKDAVYSLSSNGKRPVRLGYGSFTPVVSNKSGPNSPFSTWSAAIDALAFLHAPTKLYFLLRWMYIQRSYKYIGWLCAILLIYGPIYLIMYWTGIVANNLVLGKLSVVYNQAGKARVVASTNWWIQSALKPLHENIFRLLRNIPQDGTHDQKAAFNKFITRADSFSKTIGNNLSGYDLSAATDRLPIDLQVQILNELGIDGTLWRNILDIDWLYHPDKDSRVFVRYAVGQPMGAYSSWAMLALTHHLIVRIAALRNSKNPKLVNYAVLGDDIVINNDAVSSTYLALMDELGLKISMGKSIVSKRFTEFAKVLAGPGVDLTPLGTGLIVSALRNHAMVPAFMAVIIDRFGYAPRDVLVLLKQFPAGLYNKRQVAEICLNSVWQSFLSHTWLRELSLLNVKTLNRYSSIFAADALKFPEKLADTLSSKVRRDLQNQKENAHAAMTNFIFEALSLLAARTLPLRILELLMKPLNPGFWIYFADSLNLPIRIDERSTEIFQNLRRIGVVNPLEQIAYLKTVDPRLSVLDIAKMKPAKAVNAMKFYKGIQEGISWR